jgi:glyoxylase-like metal-dependent hydrolase (beta-lactamase superfamily II)
MAVEQQNGVVLVEAPLYDARSKALIAWASTQFPGKPVTHVVATHYHIDHSGGLREMVAAGATLVAGNSSAELYQRVLSAPSKVQPDTLETNPVDASIQLVSDADVILPDPVHPITVRRLITGHADDMVVVELPSDQVIFESDFFNPGVINFKEQEELLRDDLVARGLTAFAIVEGHTTSGPATFADLEAEIAKP